MVSFGLYLTFLILTYLRPIDAFVPELQVYRPIATLGIVALAAAIGRHLLGHPSPVRSRHIMLMAALVACVGISVLLTGWLGGALAAVLNFSTSALIFVLTVLNVTSRERLRITVATVVTCTLVLALSGIAAYHYGFMADQLLLNQNATGAEDDAPEILYRIRSFGFLNDPNDLAQAMVIILPMLACAIRRDNWVRNAIVVALPTAIVLYAIYLTHSRGAVVGVVALVCFGARRSLGRVRTAGLAAAVVTVAVLSGVAGGRELSVREESAGGRIDAWSEGLLMLKSRPVFGVGYGNFDDQFDRTAHNSFVLCFAELGLTGYFIWLGLITTTFAELGTASVLNNHDPNPFRRKWAAALRAAIIGFLACAWFLSRTYIETLYLLLALGIAVCYCDEQTRSTKLPPWVGRTALIMVGSILIVYGMVLAKHFLALP